MRKSDFTALLLLFVLLLPAVVMAQQPIQQRDPEKTWNRATDLWEKQKYASALKYFGKAAQLFKRAKDPRSADCAFYSGYCALKLYNRDAESMLRKFRSNYPEDPRYNFTGFLLGRYKFERKKYQQALEYLVAVDPLLLEKKYLSDYYYYIAYCYFMEENYSEAKKYFAYDNYPDDPYYQPSVYYLAYIDYLNQHYDKALEGFEILKNDESFSMIVPYYIAQIYFLQGRYYDVIAQTDGLYENTASKHKPELARLLGESFFKEENYEKALPYFSYYFAHSSGFSRDDQYAFGYVLYRNGDYENAISHLEKAVEGPDALSQIALLNLGDCYAKTGQPDKARTVLGKSARMNITPEVTEEAYLNYARISYQLSFNPFNEAVRDFEQYLNQTPNATRKDETYRFLLSVYLKTKNYETAISVIDKIKNKDIAVQRAYQLSVYNLGVEAFLRDDYVVAERWFQKVAKYPVDQLLLAESDYWEGEIKYRKENFAGALRSYEAFRSAAVSHRSKYYNDVYYSLGYTNLHLNAREQARDNFQLFLKKTERNDPRKLSDAALRTGDLYFISKNYDQAIHYYRTARTYSTYDYDYSLFQIAMAQGYADDQDAKIQTLNELLEKIPGSIYLPRVYYELGSAWFAKDNLEKALEHYQNVEEKGHNNHLIAQSRLKQGLIYMKMKEDAKAANTFISVIKDYPRSKEAEEALISLKEVDMKTFTQIARSTGFNKISEEDVDMANFEAAEEKYLDGNYEAAAVMFEDYLREFPKGRFYQNALFYAADAYIRLEKPEKALADYEALMKDPSGAYYENALYMAAKLSRGYGVDEKTYRYYRDLYYFSENKQYKYEALQYLMFEGYERGDYADAAGWAKEIREGEKPDEDLKQEALLIEISALDKLGKRPEADSLFALANTEMRNETSGEIWYLKALWLYEEGRYKAAEDALYFLLQNFSTWPGLRARGFILLGDVYLGMGDEFQARATWQSVVDNHKGPKTATARKKLDELNKAKNQREQEKKPEIEMDFTPGEKAIEGQQPQTKAAAAPDTLKQENKPAPRDSTSGNQDNNRP